MKRSLVMCMSILHVLGEMAVAEKGGDLLTYTTKWMERVNRGGLFSVNDNSFHLFIELERCV